MAKVKLNPHQERAIAIKDPKVLVLWERQEGKSMFIGERISRSAGKCLVLFSSWAQMEYFAKLILEKHYNAKLTKSSFKLQTYQVGRCSVTLTMSPLGLDINNMDAIFFDEPDSSKITFEESLLKSYGEKCKQLYLVGSMNQLGGPMSMLWNRAGELGLTVDLKLEAQDTIQDPYIPQDQLQ